MKNGMFITLEGADGCGKTTQLKHLAEYLEQCGYQVVCSREPGGTELAERLRELVLDASRTLSPRTETLLYIAARADHVSKVIRPALAAGKIVLCDRFADSTAVYQGFVNGVPLAELDNLSRFACEEIAPEVTLLLDGDPELLATRRDSRGVHDRYEDAGLAFQQQIRAGFLKLAEMFPERIKVIDALQPENAVAAAIIAEIDRHLAAKKLDQRS